MQAVAKNTGGGGAGVVRDGDGGATAFPANESVPNDVNDVHSY